LVDAAARARRTLLETAYAPEVLDQRRTLQARLAGALADIDRLTGLEDLARAADPEPEGAPSVDAAFLIWSQTELSRLRITSSIELFNAAGTLVSRFSLKLPDVGGAQARRAGVLGCVRRGVTILRGGRRLLHAGRPAGRLAPISNARWARSTPRGARLRQLVILSEQSRTRPCSVRPSHPAGAPCAHACHDRCLRLERLGLYVGSRARPFSMSRWPGRPGPRAALGAADRRPGLGCLRISDGRDLRPRGAPSRGGSAAL
jgi:hypothetical protein